MLFSQMFLLHVPATPLYAKCIQLLRSSSVSASCLLGNASSADSVADGHAANGYIII